MTCDRTSRLHPSVPGFVARAWAAVVNRRQTRRLYELTDRQLLDIGLTRRDVQVARNAGYLSDPAPLLRHCAMEKFSVSPLPESPKVTPAVAGGRPAAEPVRIPRDAQPDTHKAAA
ncbi:hypothetical protein GCM10011316_26210 [Roseibium aquae]|uniref:YjiS-like domain-containing protein n=1 Tax=Roseibium aquae TaxID=1323746 RepID=A0A916X1D1_9HYPH|nr:DUF1127 domain-containing protein [Roseibium aquae]GGB52914.1 hypothetical protein GCM10011316_26210 [Roseibium aquae]